MVKKKKTTYNTDVGFKEIKDKYGNSVGFRVGTKKKYYEYNFKTGIHIFKGALICVNKSELK